MLPKLLATRGYVSHHVGKWHQGFHTPDYTPVARGFNTSYGFLQGGEDHWTHWCGASATVCDIPGADGGWTKNGAWDLWSQSNADFPGHPEIGMNGTLGDEATYSGFIFTRRVVELVQAHASTDPVFVYWVRLCPPAASVAVGKASPAAACRPSTTLTRRSKRRRDSSRSTATSLT